MDTILKSENVLKTLSKYGVDLSNVVKSKEYRTGFSIILISFQGDRTVLAHRGANAHIREEDINFDAIKEADLIYIAPLNGESNKVLEKIVSYYDLVFTNFVL
mgnify:CR=1 FL=1